MPELLDDLRVLDLSEGPIGGITTMVLADFGADVVKVERPGGDPWRAVANAPMWLRGKRSAVLDLKTDDGRESLARLAEGADVVVMSGRPGKAKELGADYETLSAINPALVYCAITGFGPEGPYAGYPGYEAVVAARLGRMLTFSGLADREGPAYPAVQAGSHATSQAALHGILAALMAREESGRGQLVETSLLQGLFAYDLGGLFRAQLGDRFPEIFAGLAMPVMPTLNYHALQTKDGRWLQFGNLMAHLFDNYLAAVDLADIFADPDYEGSPATWSEEPRERLRDRMFERMLERTADEWMETFIEHGGVAATPFQSTQQALDDPDLVLNEHVVEREHPTLGTVRQLGALARLTPTPGAAGEAGPEPGEHTAEVLAEASPARSSVPATPASGPPLKGVTVLEFATVIAAPLGAAILADLGARVIKVEPIGGDPFRAMGIASLGAGRCNGSKESIALDLKSQEGQQIVQSLAASTDIIIHNYRPGVPERLGIGYETLKAIRPELVYVYVNGYGRNGPGAHRPSTHPIPGAGLGGALMQMGEGMPPVCTTIPELREIARKFFRANELNPDPNTSVVVASASLLGLYARRRFGHGQEVFVDMFGANAWANADDFIAYEGKPPRPTLDRDLFGLGPTWRLYEAAEGWVFLGLAVQPEWERFCELAGRPDLAADPRFATPDARTANGGVLAEALAALFGTRPADEWEALLATEGLGCVRADSAPVHEFIARDEHVAANGLRVPAHSANFGEYERYGPLTDFSENKLELRGFPLAGEQADAILAELGYDPAAVETLRAKGIVWSETPAPLAAVTA
ncbi:MAG: CoA transferase [Chloroflexota bacterium]|nr:CoA transferase [Chloroflexota bacterium]